MLFLKNLKKQKGIIHGIMEIKDGSFNFFANPNSIDNLLMGLEKLKIKKSAEDIILADQVHGKNVHIVPSNLSGYIKLGVDGLVSKKPGQIIAVKTADCLPVLIFNPKREMVGAIHAGREGLRKGILQETIAKMGDASSLIIGIGPHIKKCCYSFALQDKRICKKNTRDPFWEDYIQEKDHTLYLDLTQVAVDQLEKLGVQQKNIEVLEFCTFCDQKRFFSSRARKKESAIYKKYGRHPLMGSFIGLV